MLGMVKGRILEHKIRPYRVQNDLLILETVYKAHYTIRNSPSLRGRKQPFRQHMPGMEHRHTTQPYDRKEASSAPKHTWHVHPRWLAQAVKSMATCTHRWGTSMMKGPKHDLVTKFKSTHQSHD